MAVLRIQFASEQLYHDGKLLHHPLVEGFLQLEACTRNLTGDDSTIPQVQYATVTRLIQRTEHSMICQALLDGTVEVVLKLGLSPSSRARIQVEGDHYEARLKRFWGSVVPICYGLYEGPVKRPSGLCNGISCIMLEYAGEPLENFVSLPREDKRAIMTMLGQLHSVSVQPQKFAARNVVQKNGAYRLIRFHDPTLHNCNFNGDFEWDEPCSGRLGCSELETAGVNMVAWDPEDIGIYLDAHGISTEDDCGDKEREIHMLVQRVTGLGY
ncbi:hypothetical protein Hypma_011261 [Hypsizygus marmoreus]|uniref:Aminoglycoside phosphotransferase domain-containing protein n=1 Tax=Hypsizygus marmoreus TaxID=39966 RepID=A0A369JQE6_HYPMA|nr:hypothetical protein Hypma_011261 [Hypsizygus marmoreus]